MKFIALRPLQLQAPQAAHDADDPLDHRRVHALRATSARSATRSTYGVSIAGADRLDRAPQGVAHPAAARRATKRRSSSIDGVADATHATWFGAIYKDPKNFFGQMPVKPEEFLRMYPEFVLPNEQMQAWLKTRTGAIVGRTTADRFGWKVGDKIPLMARSGARRTGGRLWTFDLVGIYDGASPRPTRRTSSSATTTSTRTAPRRTGTGRLVLHPREGSEARRGRRQDASTPSSRTRRARRRRRPRRRSSRASPSRSATSARS